MSDLIERQAAIEAICNDCCGGNHDCKFYLDCDNLRSIRTLPSAQPDLQQTCNQLATDCNTHNTLDALDCISRQAAIDIVDDIRDCISVDGYWAFIERLKKTPSAQPELIRCHECKYYDGRPCGKVDWYNSADDYCSREKRREDE